MGAPSVDRLGRVAQTATVTNDALSSGGDASGGNASGGNASGGSDRNDAAGGRPDRVEIVGLGIGPRGFREVRLNGVEQPDAYVLLDLHSPLRVRIGDRIYTEEESEIVVTDA